ncbi:MAG TPA: Wzz/FepE/Etk N-terminal domain-containing protein [Acidobacteriaceae bacterium]|nr:Wzz/FepE/Etk N-terminal domain-containing protein [Acidobacteriaceae bacterium]
MATQVLEGNPAATAEPRAANWVGNAEVLWAGRRMLLRAALLGLLAGLAIAFLIPKRYTSTARIMPPDNSGSSMAMLAALTGHNLGDLGALGSLAGGLLGGRTSSALFVDLLRSGNVSGALIDRFHLQQAWHKRYRVDTAKYLAHHTSIVDDKRSGVITIEVQDGDPARARDLAQGYLDELNRVVMQTSTSSAHQQRVFFERRLASVQKELEQAQLALSDFSGKHSMVDVTEQARAMVDAAARLQAQQIAGQSEVDSLRQIYGDSNVRVRAAQARVSELGHQLQRMSGSASAGWQTSDSPDALYPPLRQLPRLGVMYVDLYRRVRVEEQVFELLTQQDEMARIAEVRDVPVISVIDVPGIPEKKSFPPRLLVALLILLLSVGCTAAALLVRDRWNRLTAADPRRLLAEEVAQAMQSRVRQWRKH